MTRVGLTRGALDHIRRDFRRSEAAFRIAARTRYRRLLDQALRALPEDQGRIGVRPIADARRGYFVHRLKWSKPRVGGAAVGRPRHLLVFSVGDILQILVSDKPLAREVSHGWNVNIAHTEDGSVAGIVLPEAKETGLFATVTDRAAACSHWASRPVARKSGPRRRALRSRALHLPALPIPSLPRQPSQSPSSPTPARCRIAVAGLLY